MGGGGSKQGVACKLEQHRVKQCSKKKTDLNNVRKRICVLFECLLTNRFCSNNYNQFANLGHEWKYSL